MELLSLRAGAVDKGSDGYRAAEYACGGGVKNDEIPYGELK
jgi:hypothetical protein